MVNSTHSTIACSSFAHSLGVYSVAFDSLNFETEMPSAGVEITKKLPPAPKYEERHQKMDIGEFPPSMEAPMAPQAPPAIAAQGNIVTTKAEAPKKIVSQAQNQINHMLVASSDKP